MPTRLLTVLLTFCVLLAAACGGSSEDEKAITKTLEQSLTAKEPKVVCGGSLSTGFMDRVYGGEDKCESVEAENAKDQKAPDSVDVSDVEVDGEKATAKVSVKGGDSDGAKGPIDLAKQGDAWRVDDLSADFLRSQFEASATADQDLDRKTLDCVKDKILDLEDAQLKEVAYASIGKQEQGQQKLVELITTCNPDLVRDQVEKSVTDSLQQQGAAQKTIDCVKRELRDRISDEELNAAAGGDGSAVQQKGTEAAKACGV